MLPTRGGRRAEGVKNNGDSGSMKTKKSNSPEKKERRKN